MKFLFLDLEFSGLNPNVHKICEIGAVVVDASLRELDVFESAIYYSDVDFTDDAFVMHSENGLLGDMQSAPEFSEAYKSFVSWVSRYRDLILAGNSIGVDKRWIESHMPKVLPYLNHRVVDLSSVKIFLDIAVGISHISGGGREHRALEDARESIRLAREICVALGRATADKVLLKSSEAI